MIIFVRIWAFNFKATFSTTRTSNNIVRWCANLWPFRVYDKSKFSYCEIATIFWILDRITILGRLFMLNAQVCGYNFKFTPVANFFINDKDGLSIFVLIASFMKDTVICPALNSYHLLLFAWFLVCDSIFDASFCVIVIVSKMLLHLIRRSSKDKLASSSEYNFVIVNNWVCFHIEWQLVWTCQQSQEGL